MNELTSCNTTLIEFLASVCGIVYLLLAFREHWACWIFYLLSAVLYIPVLVAAGTPAYAVMQILFIAAALYGLIRWRAEAADGPQVSRGAFYLHVLAGVFGIFSSVFVALCLRGTVPFTVACSDALISVFSLIATFLTIRKIIESWHYWIVINFLGAAQYLERGYQMTAVFFAANLLLSFEGLRNWRRLLSPTSGPADRGR